MSNHKSPSNKLTVIPGAVFGWLTVIKEVKDKPYATCVLCRCVCGNYEPGNCCWVSTEAQANNKRNTVRVFGKPLKQWAKELGVSYYTLISRYEYGWQDIDIISRPIKKRSHHENS